MSWKSVTWYLTTSHSKFITYYKISSSIMHNQDFLLNKNNFLNKEFLTINGWTIGINNIWNAYRQIRRLKYSMTNAEAKNETNKKITGKTKKKS